MDLRSIEDVPTPYAYRGELNVRRVDRGEDVYAPYSQEYYGLTVDREAWSMVASDLISDVMHYVHAQGVDPGELLTQVARSFVGDFEDEYGAPIEAPPEAVEGAYGSTVVGESSAVVYGTYEQLRAWSRRPGASWPCSQLARLEDGARAVFSSGDLVDLDTPGVDDLAADELNAWTSDVLRDVLPEGHPCRFGCVDQFGEVDA